MLARNLFFIVIFAQALYASITAESAPMLLVALGFALFVLPLIKYFIIRILFGSGKKIGFFYLFVFLELLTILLVTNFSGNMMLFLYIILTFGINLLYFSKTQITKSFSFLLKWLLLTLTTPLFMLFVMLLSLSSLS